MISPIGPAGGISTRRLGATGLRPTVVGIGTSALGSMPASYGYSVTAAEAAAALDALLNCVYTFVDTGADYGEGRSEDRIGEALARGAGAGMTIATKVDRDLDTGRFDGAQVLRSAEMSLKKLGLGKFPLLHLHDPEHIGFAESMRPGGAVEALVRLKDEGVAEAIGVAGGPPQLLAQFVETGLFDVVQTHNRYTLLDRTAEDLIAAATERGMGVINAAPYGGGLLSDTSGARNSYGYRPAPDALLAARSAMAGVCARYGVPLAAAALQFSTRDERVHSTIVGMSRAERAKSTYKLLATDIDDGLWPELEKHVPARDYWHND